VGPALTLDPVATGLPGWDGFLIAYNQFCSDHDGTPLFNQTGSLARTKRQKAFCGEIDQFLTIRARMDPDNRFYTEYFKRLFKAARDDHDAQAHVRLCWHCDVNAVRKDV
jgi:L-gulonolactone oxidase